MNETKGHLQNNGGVRGHSAGPLFARHGTTTFCYVRKGKVVHMLRHKDGTETPNRFH